MNKNLNVGIIGAGIQGISNALFLQKKGFKVTIFDREKPGSPVASYGNAGHFSPYASLSLNRKDILMDENLFKKIILNLYDLNYREAKDKFEKEYLIQKLKINNFNMTLTAKMLKLDRVSLYRKVKSLNIKID